MYTWMNIPKEKHTPWELVDPPRFLDPVVYPRFHLLLLGVAVLVALCLLPFLKLFELATLIRGGGAHA